MLAARWLSSRSVEKGYRELSEGRAHAGQLATPEWAAREEPFDCRSEHRGFSEGRLPDDSRYVLQPPGRAPAGPERFAIQCSRYSAQLLGSVPQSLPAPTGFTAVKSTSQLSE